MLSSYAYLPRLARYYSDKSEIRLAKQHTHTHIEVFHEDRCTAPHGGHHHEQDCCFAEWDPDCQLESRQENGPEADSHTSQTGRIELTGRKKTKHRRQSNLSKKKTHRPYDRRQSKLHGRIERACVDDRRHHSRCSFLRVGRSQARGKKSDGHPWKSEFNSGAISYSSKVQS